jgi:hypothetical protein
VLFSRVGIFGKERDVEGVLNNGEKETTPGDESIMSLVLGSEGVDDAVLVRLENETKESSLDGERGGVGRVGLEDLLSNGEKERKDVLGKGREDGAVLVLVCVAAGGT